MTESRFSGFEVPQPDYTIRIASLALEIAPGKVIRTTAYNAQVPGPLLRLQEGRPVAINEFRPSEPGSLAWALHFLPFRMARSKRARPSEDVFAERHKDENSCRGYDRAH